MSVILIRMPLVAIMSIKFEFETLHRCKIKNLTGYIDECLHLIRIEKKYTFQFEYFVALAVWCVFTASFVVDSRNLYRMIW